MDFFILKSFVILIPLFLIGILFVRRLTTIKRAEVIIPLGIITGITTYIFFLNIASYVFKGFWGIVTSLTIYLIISIILILKTTPEALDYPKKNASKWWKISLIFWGVFLYYPISHNFLGGENFIYYSIANTFAKGNFPILSPWQPDLYVAYHYGASIFLGALNSLTKVQLDQLHRLIPFILIFCMFQLLTHGFRRINSGREFLLSQIIVSIGLISYGSFMFVWPIFSIQLSDALYKLSFVDWIRQLPSMAQTMDSYGMPNRLLLFYNQMHHAFGLANFFLVFFISLYAKTKRKLLWFVLFVNLAVLCLIDEIIFPSAIISSFLILFFKEKISRVKLMLFFLLIGLVALFQGGMVTDSFFRNKSLDQGIVLTSVKQLPEKLHAISLRTIVTLPVRNEWLPFRWSHIDFILMYVVAFVLFLIIKLLREKNINLLIISSFILAAIIPNALFYLVTVKFMPSDGNRFLSFTYIFLGIAIAFEITILLEKLFLQKKIYLTTFLIIILWILIPSNLPFVFDFWTIQTKQDFLFTPQYKYKNIPPLIKWLEKEVDVHQRIVDLAGQIIYVPINKPGNYNVLSMPLLPYSGVLVPYWDGKYKAYMYSLGPDYLNILYTINPTSLKNLKVDFLVIDKQFFLFLPKIRQEQLEDDRFFTKIFVDDKTEQGYWIAVYKVNEKYLQEVPDINETTDYLNKIIPTKAKIYIDKEYEPFTWLQVRNAFTLVFKDRELTCDPQGRGGYGFLGTQLRFSFPKLNDTYDFLFLKSGTNPKNICNCKFERIWVGYNGQATLWKVVK